LLLLINLLIRNLLTKLYTIFMAQLNALLLVLLLCLPLLARAAITSFWDMSPIGQDTLHCLHRSGYLE
jgi:hypothetical protein